MIKLWKMKKYHSTILIVDDDSDDRFLIERAFRAIGVTDPIHAVSDGAEAIAYMEGTGKYAEAVRSMLIPPSSPLI